MRIDSAFIGRTYRSVAILSGFLLLVLWSYQHIWALLPLALGTLLALVLLWSSARILPQVFKAGSVSSKILVDAETKNTEIRRRLRQLLPIVLVKYLSVGVVAFVLVRFWSQHEILVFCGGFVSVQANLVMRVLSRMLATKPSSTKTDRLTVNRGDVPHFRKTT